MTSRQAFTLRVIRQFHEEHGCYPSVRELADLLGIRKTSAHDRLKRLEKAGVLRRTGEHNGLILYG